MNYSVNSKSSNCDVARFSRTLRSVSVLATSALCLSLQAPPAAADTVGVPEVTDFWLIDAATDTRLYKLDNYQTINLAFVPGQLSIEAEADGDTQSVSFTIDGVGCELRPRHTLGQMAAALPAPLLNAVCTDSKRTTSSTQPPISAMPGLATANAKRSSCNTARVTPSHQHAPLKPPSSGPFETE